MNERLAKMLAEYENLTRRGVHGTGNAYDSAEYYMSQLPDMIECGVSWVKLVVAGDSGVQTCRALVDAGIIPIVRPYNTACPANTIDRGFLQPYLNVGVVIFESPFNEFYYPHENQWGGSMPADWPAQVANGWNQFARIVIDAGGVPTTPSVEGWRYESIFRPMLAALDVGLLKQSIVAGHWRTLNHPPSYVKDTGGWLAWSQFDGAVFERVGEHLPLICTEAGPEPGWSMDPTYPAITPQMHAQMVRDILDYPTPSYYLADCFWLWEGSGAWAGASWKRNAQYAGGADLPVIEMLKTWQPDVPEPDFDDLTPEEARNIGWQQLGVPLNLSAAFFRYAQAHNLGYPLTPEWDERGHRWQGFSGGLVYAPVGQWDKVSHVTWV